jgi:hypothetical protein
MPVDWSHLVDPERAALVISECQRDVVGDLSRLPMLADAAGQAVGNIARLAEAAGAMAAAPTPTRGFRPV